MRQQNRQRCSPTLGCILALVIAGLPAAVLADEPGRTIPDPGFRPDSEYADIFVANAANSRILVLPTLVRREGRTAHSFASQRQIVAFLNESGIIEATAKIRRIDLGPLRRPSQWEIFEYGILRIAENLDGWETGADYTLVMELLVPTAHEVFGIEVYILDSQGDNAFSFLLNSHHAMFADAKLKAGDSSEAARSKMIEKATLVALKALEAQVSQQRACMR